jgi:hypothetical protein
MVIGRGGGGLEIKRKENERSKKIQWWSTGAKRGGWEMIKENGSLND